MKDSGAGQPLFYVASVTGTWRTETSSPWNSRGSRVWQGFPFLSLVTSPLLQIKVAEEGGESLPVRRDRRHITERILFF